VQHHVLEAELWLARERMKEQNARAPKQAPPPTSR
jgi:hypothetical protein